jgi:hypothetical protein
MLDRGQCGRSLAAALDDVHGFVAFIAFESAEGLVTGLCICEDRAALDAALRAADAWQRAHGRPVDAVMEALSGGEVIVQRGF